MAVYKVPQDVEADDKLLGPFSFRQFIYLIAAVLGIAMAWGLGNLFIPLAIIPLPIVIFFGALALPLRKDQPMEVYLAAVVSFYIKPRKRMWQPDGLSSLIEVTAPKVVEVQRAKGLSQDEAQKRLSYLADIVDTGGWAVRGASGQPIDTPMNSEAYYEAQQTPDVMDEAAGITQAFDAMIEKNDQKRRQEIMDKMKDPSSFSIPAQPSFSSPAPAPDPVEPVNLSYNPYPTSIRQSVIQPLSQQTAQPQPDTAAQIAQPQPVASESQLAQPAPQPAPQYHQPAQASQPVATTPISQSPIQPASPPQVPAPKPEGTSEIPVSPDIINLANQHDLSIETIAHEANRIREKEQSSDEVVISLR